MHFTNHCRVFFFYSFAIFVLINRTNLLLSSNAFVLFVFKLVNKCMQGSVSMYVCVCVDEVKQRGLTKRVYYILCEQTV